MLTIRKLHRRAAIFLGPFFIFLALSGSMLLFRKTGMYSKETKSMLVSLHTWEIIAPYIGIVIAAGLIFMAVTGLIVFFKRTA